MNGENLLHAFRLLHLSLGTINVRSGLFVNFVYGLLRYFKRNSRDGGFLNPTGLLLVFHHTPTHAQKAPEVQAKSDKESTTVGTYTTASQM